MRTTVGIATVVIEDTGLATREGAPVFEWTVSLPDGRGWSAMDLHGPLAGPEPSEEEMTRTFFSFLSAACEAREYRERTGREGDLECLFPAALLDWAVGEEAEISLLSLEDQGLDWGPSEED